MKKLLILLFLPVVCLAQTPSTIYVSSTTGDDNYTGTSAAQAWRSIAKLNSAMASLGAGSSVLFKAGDTITGGIIVKRTNITFGKYGVGPKPVINGLAPVTGWVNLYGNIWEAPVSNVKQDVNLVLRDGVIQQIGRYPNVGDANGGYLTYTASNNTSITGPLSSSTINMTGAEVAIRNTRWQIRRQKVVAHTGGTISFAWNKDIPRVGYGYFFQRDPRFLDQEGEWWYDSTNSKLRVVSAVNPSTYNYQISVVDTLFGNNQYYNNITVNNLQFIGAGKKALWMYSGSNQLITNVDVKHSGAEGISLNFSFNVDVNNCTTSNCLGSGIRIFQDNANPIKLSVTNCRVDSTALIAGMEISDVVANGGNGISLRGNKNTIWNNVITNSGYCAIEWQGNDVSIKYNVCERFCSVRDDGGGVYSYETSGSNLPVRYNRQIVGNVILYGIGANFGAKQEGAEQGASSRGLYFDEGTRTVIADSNVVAYCIGTAMHGNNNQDITMRDNIFFGNKGGYSMQRMPGALLIRGMVSKRNIIYPFRFEYRNLFLDKPTPLTWQQDLAALGTLDSNIYIRKSGDTSLTIVLQDSAKSYYGDSVRTMAVLRQYQEKNSTEAQSGFALYVNKKTTPDTLLFPGYRWKDVRGNLYENSAVVPRLSAGLFKVDGTIVVTPPPTPVDTTSPVIAPKRYRLKVRV